MFIANSTYAILIKRITLQLFTDYLSHHLLYIEESHRVVIVNLRNGIIHIINGIRSKTSLSAIRAYLYKSTLISNGDSKSFSIVCFVSFSERLACSVGIFQSIPRVSSRMLIPPSASGW